MESHCVNKLIIKNARILYEDRKFVSGDILVNGKLIEKINFYIEDSEAQVIDAKGLTVIPGLIDIHTHGGNGIDIVDCSEDELEQLCEFYASQGVTSFLATIGTVKKEKIKNCVKKINRVIRKKHKGSKIFGIHMEGPFIAREYRGAQNEEDISIPDIHEFEELYKISGNSIKIVTIAPELEGAQEFIEYAVKNEIIVSLGHTGADYCTCMKAISQGAKSITHFLNAMKGFHQHKPSIVGAALGSDVFCEMICDGRHLHPGTVRMLLKAKGIDKLVMITDSIMATGLGDGVYEGFINIIVKDGDAKLEDGARAGSTLTCIEALKNTIKFTGEPLESVTRMITENPAKLIGIYDDKGSIKEGKDADFIILDDDLNVQYTISEGNIIYTSPKFINA